MASSTSAYQAPKYDEKKYRKGLDVSYYDKATEAYKQQKEIERQNQLIDAAATKNSALKQAYIQRMQNQRKLNDDLAMSGIRGGATETSNLRLNNQYGQARASANTDFSNSVKSINQSIDQNIADYQSDMDSRKEEYLQNMAQARWQAEREDYTNEVSRQTQYWSNYYVNYYSGKSKKACKNAVDNLQKKLRKEKNPLKQIKLQQAIAGAQARLGVIATSK